MNVKLLYYSTFSEDEDADDNCATSSTIPEDEDTDDDCATCSTIPEDEDADDICATNSKLSAFIHENYYELESIFEAYIGLTDDEEEAELLKNFLPLLHEVKENVRNKVRFGF